MLLAAVADTRVAKAMSERKRRKRTMMGSCHQAAATDSVGESGSSSRVPSDRLLGRTVHPQGHFRLLRRQTKSAQRGRE